jgi:hypothetical protein
MDRFFQSNPGMSSRIAHHVDFPDYTADELLSIAQLMLDQMQYRLSDGARQALVEYIAHRREQPNFANARSMRNGLDRARLRQANRLVESRGGAGATPLTRDQLMTIEDADIRASRVFDQGKTVESSS